MMIKLSYFLEKTASNPSLGSPDMFGQRDDRM